MVLYVAFAVLLIYGVALLRSDRLMPKGTEWLLPAILLAVSLGLRLYLILQRVSFSAEILSVMENFRATGILGGLRYSTSPLSIPLQLLIALCCVIPSGSETVFRILCVFASITGAWGCQRAVQAISSKTAPRLTAFIVFLFLPSVVLSDAAGTGMQVGLVFFVLAVECLLSSRVVCGGIFFGLAIAFRPGLALLFPVLFVFKVCSSHKWKTLLITAGSYFVIQLPTILMGRAPARVLPLWPGIPYIFSLPAANGCPGLFSAGLTDFPAVVGIILYAVGTALLVWFLGRRELLRDKRGHLCILGLSASLGCLVLPWTTVSALMAPEVILLILCCVAPGGILSAIGMFLCSGAAMCGVYLPSLAIPYGSYLSTGCLVLSLALLLLYAFGRPTKGAK